VRLTGLQTASESQNQRDSNFSFAPDWYACQYYRGIVLAVFPVLDPKTVLWSPFSKKRALTGAPAVRRMKTYSAQSGYVYQYYYDGQRPFGSSAAGIEFVFSVSADRASWRPASVLIGDAAIAAWQDRHGRQLSSTERYALAKMALFQAFDERATPERMKDEVLVRPADVEAIADTLGFD
jgi:hypothetical protein